MQKSTERTQLEGEINQAHIDSLNVAMSMVEDEFDGDLEKALSDGAFVSRMQSRIKQTREIYRQGYRKLEDLERKEAYPAMTICADILDKIREYLPVISRNVCYYPFSGVDFYWARIFDRIIFEDIGFNQDELPNMWWDSETYGYERRQEIIGILQTQRIIPKSTILKFISGDADVSRADNQFNDPTTTLLVKGGHDFLGYVESRFNNGSLKYNAIIIVTAKNPPGDVERRLKQDGYTRIVSIEGTDYLIPYAMELRDINIFLK